MLVSTVHIIEDGPRRLTVNLVGIGDGNGDESNVVKVDVSTLSPPADRLRVERIDYDISFGLVELLWDQDVPEPFEVLAGNDEKDYLKTGGPSNTLGLETNGNLLLSTRSFEADSSYNILLEMVKKY